MNETQTHFSATCPYCSTRLRIRRVFAGQQVQCKHCNETFVAKETDEATSSGSGDGNPGQGSSPSADQERAVVTCPNCRTSLSIRRIYIGRQVRCKQCDENFLASDPSPMIAPSRESRLDVSGNNDDSSALRTERDRLSSELHRVRDEHEKLETDHHRLSAEHDQRKSDLERLKEEGNSIRGSLDRATSELESIRAHLGDIEPASVRPLIEGHAALLAEVETLEQTIKSLRVEREAMESERTISGAEIGRLAERIEASEKTLTEAHAEQDRLRTERQSAIDEVRALRSELTERERTRSDEHDHLRSDADSLRIDSERLRSELEDLRRAQDLADQNHREELDRLEESLRIAREDAQAKAESLAEGDRLRAEIEDLRRCLADAEIARKDDVSRLEIELETATEQNRQLHERHEAIENSCRELRERNQELQAALDPIRSNPKPIASDEELLAARAEAETLRKKLASSERLQREMTALLAGMGINFHQL